MDQVDKVGGRCEGWGGEVGTVAGEREGGSHIGGDQPTEEIISCGWSDPGLGGGLRARKTRTLIWDLEECLAEERRRCGERLAMSQQETPM